MATEVGWTGQRAGERGVLCLGERCRAQVPRMATMGCFLCSVKHSSEWTYIKGSPKKLLPFYNYQGPQSPAGLSSALFDTSLSSAAKFGEFLGVLQFRIWLAVIPGQRREESQDSPLPTQGATSEKLEAAAAGRLG